MNVNIIHTGSSGNCAVVDDALIIDAGWNVLPDGDAVLLTHQHSDHTKYLDNMQGIPIYALEETINKLKTDPKYTYMAFNYLVKGVHHVIHAGNYDYYVLAEAVNHDVPCVGFDIIRRDRISATDEKRIFFATDFHTLKHEDRFIKNLRDKVYDAIYIEANNTLNPTDFMDIHFPEEGEKQPRDAFHRERSYHNHANVDYIRSLFVRAGYSEDNKFTEPVTLLHKSSYYYSFNPERVVELCKMVKITNPLY